MFKKVMVGLTAGFITGLFGSGGRNGTSSCLYLYIKTSVKKRQERHLFFAYYQWCVQVLYFILIPHI